MTQLFAAVLIAAPGTALAHDLPYVHAHPHGVEIVLGAFAVIAAASLATWRLDAARQRRDRGEDVRQPTVNAATRLETAIAAHQKGKVIS